MYEAIYLRGKALDYSLTPPRFFFFFSGGFEGKLKEKVATLGGSRFSETPKWRASTCSDSPPTFFLLLFFGMQPICALVLGRTEVKNYANVDLICKIAQQEKVDAVWPGWGHASENPRLPAKLKESGITFIGPTSPVMSVLGDALPEASRPDLPFWLAHFGFPIFSHGPKRSTL